MTKLSAEGKAKAGWVLSHSSVFRRMPIRVIPCDPDMYLFLVQHPDVVVNIWEVMGASHLAMQQTGPDGYKVSDDIGTTGTIEFLYRSHDTHVVYVEGAYTGSLFGQPIRARGLMLLKSGYLRETDGRYYITCRLDAFMHIEPSGVEFLTKTFLPMVSKVADNNFTQTAAFLASVSRTAEVNLRGMQRLASKLSKVQPEIRQEFAQVAERVAQRVDPAKPLPAADLKPVPFSRRRTSRRISPRPAPPLNRPPPPLPRRELLQGQLLELRRSTLPVPRTGICSTWQKLSGDGTHSGGSPVALNSRQMSSGGLGSPVCRTTSRSPLRGIGDAGHRQREVVLVEGQDLAEGLFDADVRDHLPADLAEAALAAGDADKAVLVDLGDVAGHVPAVADHLGRQFRLIEIALHDVGAFYQQHARLASAPGRGRSPGPPPSPRCRPAAGPRSPPCSPLEPLGGATGRDVGRDARRELRGPVSLQGPHAELLLEGVGQLLGQLLGAGDHQLQRGEVLRRHRLT